MDYLMMAALVSPMILAIGGIVCFAFAFIMKGRNRAWTGTISATFFTVTFITFLALAIRGFDAASDSVYAVLTPNNLGLLIALLSSGLGSVASIYSQGSLDPEGPVTHFYPLMLFAIAGTIAIGFANDLFTMFVMVELSALPSYALVAYYHNKRKAATVASIKYFVQGIAGTLTALFGISLMYVSAGTLKVSELQTALFICPNYLCALSAILIISGYGVKIALVPLHTWLPDAYYFAPTGVTAIMAGATKAGAAVALFRAVAALPITSINAAQIGLVISILAILTMTFGNFLALGQKDLRRMLSYSSIAQMGYVLLGFGVGLQYSVELGLMAGLFYLAVYGIMKGGAFLCAGAFSKATNGGNKFDELKGVGARHPVVGVSFALFILGLIGIPATAGFPGKLMLFQAGLAPLYSNSWLNWGTVLIVALALNSALSLGYYVPALNIILFKSEHGGIVHSSKIPTGIIIAIVPLAITTVILGLYPQLALNLADPGSVLFRPGGWP